MPVLDVYQQFFQQLNATGIAYCSWKNNHLLDESLAGLRDIDLLVDINRLAEFETLTGQFSFVEFVPPSDTTRCIRHYYKFDEEKAIFLHMHVYFRIITGESLFKNYQLPFEQDILNSATLNAQGIKEANPQHQNQLYAIRQFIKCSSLPSLVVFLRDREDYSDERAYLNRLLDSEHDEPEVNFGTEWVQAMQGSRFSRFLSGFAIRRRYKCYRLSTGLAAIFGSYKGLIELVSRRIFRKKGKRGTGLIVSIAGIDGSGKSSAVDDLAAVFGKVVSTRKMQFGRPPFGLLTFPFWLGLQIYKKLKKPSNRMSTASAVKNTGLIQGVRLVSIAADRWRVMSKANKLRGKGYLIIMDRCPVETIGCMDAPKIGSEGGSRFMQWLMKTERGYYQRMAKVDHAIYMRTTVETAIARNNAREKAGKESDDDIRDRYRQNSHAKFAAAVIHEVNTEKELDAVRKETRSLLWTLLASTN